jgi:hypothetical protein
MSSSDLVKSCLRSAARSLAIATILTIPESAIAQATVGRFLIAVGTVVVERGAERVTAAPGLEVRKGDTIQVGQQSNAQVRFVDESIVALRAGTTFKVTDLSLRSQGAGKDSAFFSLLKGGMRTVTGLIGRASHDDYAVETPTATIGIRGTHYTLRVCADDCFEATKTTRAPSPVLLVADNGPTSDAGPVAQIAQEGQRVPNGTYGGVSEGRISVTNQSGAREFGTDQYFHVASRNSAPQQLIGPPSFLRDRLEGRGRGQPASPPSQQKPTSGTSGSQQGGTQQSVSQQAGTQQGGAQQESTSAGTAAGGESTPTLAPTGQGGGTGDTRASSSVSTPVVTVPVTPTVTAVTNQISTAGPASVLQLTTSSANNVYRFAGTGLNIPVQCPSPPCAPVVAADLIVTVNPTSQTARVTLAFQLADGSKFNVNNTYGDFPVRLVGNQQVINATTFSANFPQSKGSFFSFISGGPGLQVLVSTTYQIAITGNTATATFSGVEPSGNGGTFTVALPQVSALNNVGAAIAGRSFGVNGGAGAYVQTNAAGQPVQIGEPLGIGNNQTFINTATNQTLGSDAGTGLQWGTWTGPAVGVRGDYSAFTQPPAAVSPWITGTITNVLPPSLGVVSFTPFVSVIGNGVNTSGTLNSASLTADFVNRSLALSLNATNSPGGGVYQMNGNAGFSAINGRFAAGFSTVSCTGSCGTGTLGGTFTGSFVGANAAGVGLSFQASTANAGIFGIVGFRK